MEYCLTTEALCKTYRQGKALHNVTMHVPKGAIYGFVGKNGAGKTTLIRLICGLQAPTAGGYTLYGVRNTDPSIHRVRRRMGAVVESPAIYLDLTAEDNLRLQARLLGLPSEEDCPAAGTGGPGGDGAKEGPKLFPGHASAAGDCRGPLWRAGFPGAG
ncbi:MAG: ATP-binding cassette domain-containing protein [Evtepia gabavorous]